MNEMDLLEIERLRAACERKDALLRRVSQEVCDSFATRPEYPTLCDDIDAELEGKP